MRCLACNVALNDVESVTKSAVTGEFLDLCSHCIGETEVLPDIMLSPDGDIGEYNEQDWEIRISEAGDED